MKIKKLLNSAILSIAVTLVSCEGVIVEKKAKGSDSHKLISQTDINTDEKVVSIAEVLANDIAFAQLNKMVTSSEFSTTLNGSKPYTLLAPLNGAFSKLAEGTIEHLIDSENKKDISTLMNSHIIPGTVSEQDIIDAIDKGKGSVKLKTLQGSRLIASRKRGKIYLIDENGNAGRLMSTDIKATNGVIHTLETVMLPKK